MKIKDIFSVVVVGLVFYLMAYSTKAHPYIEKPEGPVTNYVYYIAYNLRGGAKGASEVTINRQVTYWNDIYGEDGILGILKTNSPKNDWSVFIVSFYQLLRLEVSNP
jgi:hypothetical protein